MKEEEGAENGALEDSRRNVLRERGDAIEDNRLRTVNEIRMKPVD